MKVLIWDIETSTCEGHFWRPGWKVNIPHENIVKESAIICISYKWLGERGTKTLTWTKKFSDKALVTRFLKIYNSADMTVAHNGKKFDLGWLMARAAKYDLRMKDVPMCDTYLKARSAFNFNSNRLDYLAGYLGVGGKMSTGGFDLWKRTMAGDTKALNKMVKYCEQDVKILEGVYRRLEPFIKLPVSVGALTGSHGQCCAPSCGSSNLRLHSYRGTAAGKKAYYQCKDCGKYQFNGKNLVKDSSSIVRS